MKTFILALMTCFTLTATDTVTLGKIKGTLENKKTFETYSLEYSKPLADLNFASLSAKGSIAFDAEETYGTTKFGYSAWGFGVDADRNWKNFTYGVGASYLTESISAGTFKQDEGATYWNWHVNYTYKNYVFGYKTEKVFGSKTAAAYGLNSTTTLSVGMKF